MLTRIYSVSSQAAHHMASISSHLYETVSDGFPIPLPIPNMRQRPSL
jgi:hypothetical protein